MGRQAILSIKESTDDLQLLKKRHKENYQQIRLQALLLIKEQTFKKRSEIALAIGKNVCSLKRWIKVYKESGIEALLKNKSGGATVLI